MKARKLLLAAVAAAMLVLALVSSASAGRLSSSSTSIRVSFREITFNLPFGNTTCAVTLEGSFHGRTIAKTAGLLVGYITRATMGACAAGSVTILAETLPWHIRYASFAGTLPNITSFRVNAVNASFRVREPFGVTCLVRSTEGEPIVLTANREAGGAVAGAEVGGTVRVGSECLSASGTFGSDRGTATVAGAATRITITLI
jgi:hypothetical protein